MLLDGDAPYHQGDHHSLALCARLCTLESQPNFLPFLSWDAIGPLPPPTLS